MARIRHIGILFAIALVAGGAVVLPGFARAAGGNLSCGSGQFTDYAQGNPVCATSCASGEVGDYNSGLCITGGCPSGDSCTAASNAFAAGTPAAGGNNQGAWNTNDPFNTAFGWVFARIASLFAWLLGVAAVILDTAVYYTIVHMGNFFNNVQAIGVVWGVLRNVGNIALIFGFVLSGIAVIVDANLYGYGSKMLPMLLVAAIFLNFSLFIGEAIVDVGNLFATEIFTQINGGTIPSPTDTATLGGSNPVTNEGISNRIMSVIGLQNIYNAGSVNNQTQINNLEHSAITSFMAMLLFLIAAFVFFSLAFIVIARFVALVFLLVVAPLGFAGLVIPGLKGIANKWWSQLIDQTITAPVLILLLYIALAVITDANFLASLSNLTGSNTSNTSVSAWQGFLYSGTLTNFAGIVLIFLVAMGLLLAVVVLAKQMSVIGATWATKMGGRLSFGAVAWGGRLTVGSVGSALASKRMQGWMTPREGEGRIKKSLRYSGRLLTFTGKGLRAGTYDPRNAGLNAALGALGINAGTGAKLTAKQITDAQYGIKPTREYFQASSAEYQAAGRERDMRVAEREVTDLQQQLASGRITRAAYDAAVAPHEKLISDNLAKMSTKQLEELSGIKSGVEALVHNLSPEQFTALLKSDKLTDTQKGAIKEGRYAGLSRDAAALSAGTATDADVQKQLRGMTKADLESLPDALRTEGVMRNLSPDQFETIMKSDKYSDTEQHAMAYARFGELNRQLATGIPANVKAQLNKMSKTDVEYLPEGMLSNSIVLDQLSDSQRDTITDSKRHTPIQKDQVRATSASGKVKAVYDAAVAAAGGPGAAGAAAAGAAAVALPGSGFDRLTTPQIVKLDKGILIEPAVAAKLTTPTLIKLAEEHKFTPREMQAVGIVLRSTPGADPKTVDYITTGPGSALW